LRFVELRESMKIDDADTVLRPSDNKGDGGQVLRAHDSHAVSIPLHMERAFEDVALKGGCLP